MGDKTAIQWSDATWNPTTGCDRVSPGCDNCYALTQAKRLKAMGQPKYQRDGDPRTSGPGFGLSWHPDTLDIPLQWTRPRRIFVNSMSDLWHDEVPAVFIGAVFDRMRMAHWHTFQLLTKRHARLRALSRSATYGEGWPLPNVWLGVSAENQQWADIRIPALLETPAAVRFVSAEPLLGPISLPALPLDDRPGRMPSAPDWLIIGGESGPGARPMDTGWVRDLLDQCKDFGITPFVKQLGSVWARQHGGDSHGGDWGLWPEDLRVREFPESRLVAC